MKTRNLIVLLAIMVLLFSRGASADGYYNSVPVAWETYIVENTTGQYTINAVPVTTIRPNKAILGYTILPIASDGEYVVALYDGTGATSVASDELFDEMECDGTQSRPYWFPYPRKILTQLVIHVGPQTRAIIYWE